jgi:uncharacterized protein
MPPATGRKAIDRALNSIESGGTLELGFFGGEPLIEAELILGFADFARVQAQRRGITLSLSMTTNGTIDTPNAWSVMTLPEMHLCVSHDGLPSVHDRHRVAIDGLPSSERVEQTIARLIEDERDFRVVLVVQPNNVDSLTAGLSYLYSRGVRHFDPSLDLWTTWTRDDGERLRNSIAQAASFWVERLPACSVSWFDEKASGLAHLPTNSTARCGFGQGEIAVTPLGNLYPCERLVGADQPDNAMRLPGHVLAGRDFLTDDTTSRQSADECAPCALMPTCSTTCRCSNYVRTGDIRHPDGLLCLWDQACHRETLRVLQTRDLAVVSS